MKKARLIPGWSCLEATPLGLEPRIKEPKSLVLPITPRSNHFSIKLDKLSNKIFEVYTLSTSLTTGVFPLFSKANCTSLCSILDALRSISSFRTHLTGEDGSSMSSHTRWWSEASASLGAISLSCGNFFRLFVACFEITNQLPIFFTV